MATTIIIINRLFCRVKYISVWILKKNQKQNTDWYAPSFLLFGHEFQHILKNSSFFFLSLLVLTSILPILCLITQRIQDYSPCWRFILIRMVSWCFVSVSTEALKGQTKHSSIYIVWNHSYSGISMSTQSRRVVRLHRQPNDSLYRDHILSYDWHRSLTKLYRQQCVVVRQRSTLNLCYSIY